MGSGCPSVGFVACVLGKRRIQIRPGGATLREMSEQLVINEIYLSLQGESTFAGLPCIFVRLTACNLRCSYCDTAYAFTEGKQMSLTDVCGEVFRLAKSFSERAPSR